MQSYTVYLYLETALHVLGGTGFKSSFVEELKYESNIATQKYALHSGVDFFILIKYIRKLLESSVKQHFERKMTTQALTKDKASKAVLFGKLDGLLIL
jgi:hypothetical protein